MRGKGTRSWDCGTAILVSRINQSYQSLPQSLRSANAKPLQANVWSFHGKHTALTQKGLDLADLRDSKSAHSYANREPSIAILHLVLYRNFVLWIS